MAKKGKQPMAKKGKGKGKAGHGAQQQQQAQQGQGGKGRKGPQQKGKAGQGGRGKKRNPLEAVGAELSKLVGSAAESGMLLAQVRVHCCPEPPIPSHRKGEARVGPMVAP